MQIQSVRLTLEVTASGDFWDIHELFHELRGVCYQHSLDMAIVVVGEPGQGSAPSLSAVQDTGAATPAQRSMHPLSVKELIRNQSSGIYANRSAFTARIANALTRSGVDSTAQLLTMTKSEILAIDDIGHRALNLIMLSLRRYGLFLQD